MTLSERLREARHRAGYENASAFADALGVRANTVYRIERADIRPSVATLARWAEVCGVTSDSLLGIAPARRRKRGAA
jgi:transcriptional regulator with XRE-family HTH domain